MPEEPETSLKRTGGSAAARRFFTRTFSSLQHRNWRLLWTGTLSSQSGEWMDMVTANWVVLLMTGSPLYLGLFNLVRALPALVLGLMAGVVIDRVETRRLLLITQSSAMVLSFVMAVLLFTGVAQIWHLFLIGTLRGAVMAFNTPARFAIISDLVPRNDVTNAVALHSTTLHLTRVIGPALAGMLIAGPGPSSPYFLAGISYIAVIYSLFIMDRVPAEDGPRRRSMWRELGEGLDYVRINPDMLTLMILYIIPVFLGYPYMTMLTVFAQDVLGIGAVGLGLLTSAAGVGSLIGSLVVASLGDYQRKGVLMLNAMLAFGGALALFSLSPWPMLSALLVAVVACMGTMYGVSNNGIIQLLAPANLRGRLLSILSLERGLAPLGTAMAGASASVVGAPPTMAAMGAAIALLALVVRKVVPSMSTLK